MSSLVNHNDDDTKGLATASTAAAAPNGEQKRPNSNDAECEPEGKKRRVEEDAKPPAAERCYICFDLRDDDGELAVRDCSCRGGAGYAHKSCIVQYAKMNHDEDRDDFVELWAICPQCKQHYQNDLALDLANEAVSFVEGRAPASREWHLCEQLAALDLKLSLNSHLPQEERVREMESTTNKIFSIVEEMKTFVNASHLDKLIHSSEVSALMSLGSLSLERSAESRSKSGAEAALGYFEKCRAMSEETDMGGETSTVLEAAIDVAKQMLDGKAFVSVNEEQARRMERLYEEEKKEKGEDSADVIQMGLNLAGMYLQANKIKAERLLTKLVDRCRRVHGTNHGVTRQAMAELQWTKERYVAMKGEGGQREYQALRYEKGGAKCILQGPIEEPRNVDGEETLTVPTGDVWCLEGTPVICQCSGSLTRAKRQIDGKIGVAGCWDDKRDCYEVRFEDEDVGTRWVKRESVRILFELPGEETEP